MIRHFQIGDIVRLQRLSRYAARLDIERAVISPRSPSRVAITHFFPWITTKVITEVLQQDANGLARSGIIQLRKRVNRDEADVVFLAPDLAAPRGHPAIWQKLIPHAVHEAAKLGISRIYVDLPDQPLPIETFANVGFTLFTRETVLRLSQPRLAADIWTDVHPQSPKDEWALQQLYARSTPKPVQQAEGGLAEDETKAPILQSWLSGETCGFMLLDQGEVRGYLRMTEGMRGVWLTLWLDPKFQPGQLNQLIHFASTYLHEQGVAKPIYIGVRDYQGGVKGVLGDFGFAPMTDRVRMVKHVMAWAKAPQAVTSPALDAVREAMPAAMPIPKTVGDQRG